MSEKISHKEYIELWNEIERRGGARQYVKKELIRQGVFVKRVKSDQILKMSESAKKKYIIKLDREAKLRKPLQAKVWRAYCECHMVHLGQGIHWYDTLDVDKFDPDEREKRIANFGLPKLETIDDLCDALGLTLPELRWFCYHRDAARTIHYRTFTIPKKSGGERHIWAPLPKLKALQKWIQLNIIERLPVHGAAHGFLPGRSIFSNACEHVNSRVVISMDMADFFPTLTFPRVKGIFRKAGYLEGIAILLALICTEAPREKINVFDKDYFVSLGPRCLPQGSPASPALTNVACMRLDKRLVGLADKYGWKYTRYADDLTFSFPNDNKDKCLVGALTKAVTGIVEAEGFSIRKDKTHIMKPHNVQRVTGLVVNGDYEARPLKKVKRTLRAAIYNLSQGRPTPEGGLGTESLIGLAAFVHMSDPQTGKKFLEQLSSLPTQT